MTACETIVTTSPISEEGGKSHWMAIEELKAQAIKQTLALENCMLLSLREIRRAIGRADANAEEQWRHILRFCESAGIKPSVLR